MQLLQKHTIQKQVLQVRMNDPEDGFSFRSRLGEIYYDMILPRLELLFDEVGHNRQVRIDRLEINIGEIDKNNWEVDLVEKIIKQLRNEVQLVQTKLQQNDTPSVKYHPQAGNSNELEEWLLDYLRSGKLPWFVDANYQLVEAVKHVSLTGNLLADFIDFLQQANTQQLTRFVYLFEVDRVDKILQVAAAPRNSDLLKFFLINKASLIFYLQKMQIYSFNINKLIYLPLVLSLRQNEEKAIASFLFWFCKMVGTECSRPYVRVKEEIRHLIVHDLVEQISDLEYGEQTGIKTNQQSKPYNNKSGEEFYIKNAGLILLHPFLLQLFKAVGLVENNVFKRSSDQHYAVLITQYLVTGEIFFHEHEMLLNKILCGMDADEPLPNSFIFGEREKAEADQLLQTIIDKWMMNGVRVNNSVDGFRSSFLNRAGKLEKKNDDWKLVVEQEPFDLVLASLPWSIGVIKNSWMKGMLWADWA
jgi:hypothetical protein